MASLRTTESGSYIACFRFGGRQYQRGLKTTNAEAAKAAIGAIINRAYKITTGDLAVPSGFDVADFIVWGQAAVDKATKAVTPPVEPLPSLEQLVPKYFDDQTGLKADSTLGTERTHLRNLQEFLGAQYRLPLGAITGNDLNAYLKSREKQVEPVTVLKERQTLVAFFRWACLRAGIASPADELRTVQAGDDKGAFRTLAEVEEIVARGGLDDVAACTLWEGLFLTPVEIADVLTTVQEKADADFVHPMFALTAYTGMRRGEIIRRLRWADVDFRTHTITARSQKQSRQQRETSRSIAMHPELEAVLLEYKAKRPRGQHVICSADSFEPLTVHQAHGHFQRALAGSKWQRALPSGEKKIMIIGFHTFRHSFASNLAMQGVDQRIIDAWMGHQTVEMRKRYQHLVPSKLAEAMQTLSFAKKP